MVCPDHPRHLGVVADVRRTRSRSCTRAGSSRPPPSTSLQAPAHPYTRGLLDSIPALAEGPGALRESGPAAQPACHPVRLCVQPPLAPSAGHLPTDARPSRRWPSRRRELPGRGSECHFWKETIQWLTRRDLAKVDVADASTTSEVEAVIDAPVVRGEPIHPGPQSSSSTSRSPRASSFRRQVGAVEGGRRISSTSTRRDARIVGESGCGKSTAPALMRWRRRPRARSSTRARTSPAVRARAEGCPRNIQMVFQDPYNLAQPPLTWATSSASLRHPPRVARRATGRRKVQDLLDVVGLNPEYINRLSAPVSGGQRQRIGIARGPRAQPRDHHLRRAGLAWTSPSRLRSST